MAQAATPSTDAACCLQLARITRPPARSSDHTHASDCCGVPVELFLLHNPFSARSRGQFSFANQGLRLRYHAEVGFELPHPVIRRRVAGVATWRGTAIEFVLTPHPTDVEGISAVGGVVSTSGATRWPSGTCEVSLSLLKLVDHAAPTPALVANPEPPGSPHAHTPLAQALVYVLTADLLAALVGELPEDVDSLWVLTPRDISRYSFRQHANGRAVVDIPMVSIGGWRMSAGALEPLEMHLAQLESEPYWQLGYRQAAAYLALGATRESVAWINMAAESLIDSRIAELVARRPELEGTFTSGRLLFAEAESVVTSQFPDLAGRVEWPDTAVQPSR